MSCDCGSKDQTHQSVFEYLDENEIDILSSTAIGIGGFLVPDPEAGILEDKVVLVADLTYRETQKRGHNCIAYKWMPYGFSLEGKSGGSVVINNIKDLDNSEVCKVKRCKYGDNCGPQPECLCSSNVCHGH